MHSQYSPDQIKKMALKEAKRIPQPVLTALRYTKEKAANVLIDLLPISNEPIYKLLKSARGRLEAMAGNRLAVEKDGLSAHGPRYAKSGLIEYKQNHHPAPIDRVAARQLKGDDLKAGEEDAPYADAA